jgi:hypothetical protein
MTPIALAIGRPKPNVVERFADGLDDFLQGKGTLAVLWYNNWNAPLLAYYRVKDDQGEARLYYGRHAADVWSMTVVPGEDRAARIAGVVAGIQEAFREARAVIIPEFTDDYGENEPYALYRYHDDWAPWVNSPAAPRMRVVMILQESQTKRLLVLQREAVATGAGDPLRLPWGKRSAAAPGADYSAAVQRFH